ncbi:MAG: DNA topoisomerase (ATP-hydrolyzing) subunit A [Spirochaetales bacterium]|nr:DNA topoisomerase (ATP-hydrolyzing) subunit A [Spirochaetales bacterium]
MGNTIPVIIEDEMRNSYLNYAMSVIISRAIPDVRDGLKPVHRRILYSMDEIGLRSNTAYKKCARIVGDVLGKYHPHGDASVYDALVRMAQDFSLRYPVVDGHGNFGSVDNDPPAAMRYTESRMSKIAELMLKDIKKETVDFGPNYDDSLQEPMVLPAAIPFLLVNGTSGIAVGMATNIPPYNLAEVVQAISAQIDNPDITLDELIGYLKGPDFPTGGIIYGMDGINKAFKTGRGHIVVRAKVSIEQIKKEREAIIVEELPYQVCKAALIEKIAQLVKEERIQGISDIRDESDREGMRIVIELKKNIIPKIVLNQLYANTSLQINFSVNNLVLDKGMPKILNIKQTIAAYIDFRKDVIFRRTKYDLRKAEERAHIVQGLLIALDNIDEVIKLIKESADTNVARQGLMDRFGLSEIQAQAILDMRLQKLTNLETTKLKEEYEELLKTIAYYKEVLASEAKVLQIVKEELIKDTEPFLDKRRTQIVPNEVESVALEDIVQKENMVVTLTHRGFIKRMSLNEFKSQSKGGVGVSAGNVREDDFIEHLFVASTHEYLLFLSNKGMVYQVKVHEIPLLSKNAKGDTIKTMIGISPNEEITTAIAVKNFDPNRNLFFVTRQGVVKRVSLSEFEKNKTSGKRALSLDENDSVVEVKVTDGSQDVIICSRQGKALRMKEESVRVMGRAARGVAGIKLTDNDEVCGMCVVNNDTLMLLVTENGYGKRLDCDLFAPHGRGTGGQRYYKYNEAKGEVVAVKQVAQTDDIMAITSSGKIIKIHAATISQQGRSASGIKLVKIVKPDFVVAVAQSPTGEDNPPEPQEDELPEQDEPGADDDFSVADEPDTNDPGLDDSVEDNE